MHTATAARYGNIPETQASSASRSPTDAELRAANRKLTGGKWE
jgi:hypothetical protein